MSKVNEFYKHKGRTRSCLYFYVFFVCFVSLCLLFFIRGNIVDKHYIYFSKMEMDFFGKEPDFRSCQNNFNFASFRFRALSLGS